MDEDILFEKYLDYLDNEDNLYLTFEQFKIKYYPMRMSSEILSKEAFKRHQLDMAVTCIAYNNVLN